MGMGGVGGRLSAVGVGWGRFKLRKVYARRGAEGEIGARSTCDERRFEGT